MKNIFILCAFFLPALCGLGQGAHVELGLKGGLNVSNLKRGGSITMDAIPGIHLGGLAHIHLTTHVAFQPELVFSTQGGRQNIYGTNYKTYLNYLNVPILFQYMFGKGFRLQTGPQLGVLLSAKDAHGEVTDNIITNCSRYELEWALGASYVSSSGVGLDLRYNLGMTNIYAPTLTAYFNRVIQFGIFYQFLKHAHEI
jgi:hypothetical protein